MSIKNLKAKMEAVRQEMRALGQPAIVAELKGFFEKHPDVTAVGWTQYAPHFNDGDACIFSVHDFAVTTNPDTKAAFRDFRGWGDGPFEEELASYGLPKNVAANLRIAEGDIVDDDLFREVFGEDCKVMITRDGEVSVDSVEHD